VCVLQVEDVLSALIRRKQFDVVMNYVDQYPAAAPYAISTLCCDMLCCAVL